MAAINNQAPNNELFRQRVRADDRLDMLFMREMRCPYCQTRMPKGTSKCKNCGISKEQIYYAKLVSPYRPSNNALMSKVRPADLPFWKMGIGAMFGFLGIHCFIAKRYIRGVIMLLLTISFLVLTIIFPPAVGTAYSEVRQMFETNTYLFPSDLVGIFALGLWVWDWFAVLFGQFKYPVQLEIKEEA